MKNNAYKYPNYSHLGVYIPEFDFSWYAINNIKWSNYEYTNDKLDT